MNINKENTIRMVGFNPLFFLKILFIPIFYELVIGGGGRFLEVGPLSFRMLFFAFSLSVSFLYCLYKKKIKRNVAVILFVVTILLIFSSIVGVVNHAETSLLFSDLKPLLFFYMLLFFSLVIKDLKDIEKVISIIKKGAIVMGVIYILVIALLFLGKIDFATFYSKQYEIGEVLFKGDSLFFYKGFIYICIGFFFFLFSTSKYKNSILLFLFSCIVLTLTRGFILFTSLIFIYYIFFINKNIFKKWVMFLLLGITVITVIPFFLQILGDKSESDNVRFLLIDQVIFGITPLSLLIGHGFGIGVEIRPEHMEISFLNIFHKQGLIGVTFWLGLFFYIFFMYHNIKDKDYKKVGLPFLLGVIFVILQSTTNPYMNNPIGLSLILITVVIFSRLLELQKTQSLN